MQKDYKLRQRMYHHLEPIDDYIDDKPFVVVDVPGAELIEQIISYFQRPSKQLIYPAKSYAVAIIYARLLNQYFSVPILKALDDPDLFLGNDKFFVPYNRAKFIYDVVLERNLSINTNLPQVRTTVDYFMKEFYLIPNPYFDNADLT